MTSTLSYMVSYHKLLNDLCIMSEHILAALNWSIESTRVGMLSQQNAGFGLILLSCKGILQRLSSNYERNKTIIIVIICMPCSGCEGINIACWKSSAASAENLTCCWICFRIVWLTVSILYLQRVGLSRQPLLSDFILLTLTCHMVVGDTLLFCHGNNCFLFILANVFAYLCSFTLSLVFS